jgi:hypothetical protein
MTTAAPPDSELIPYAMEYYFKYEGKMIRITRFSYNGGLVDDGRWVVCIARSSTNPWYLNHGNKYDGTWQYKHGTPFVSAEDALRALKRHGVIDDAKSEARLAEIREVK